MTGDLVFIGRDQRTRLGDQFALGFQALKTTGAADTEIEFIRIENPHHHQIVTARAQAIEG